MQTAIVIVGLLSALGLAVGALLFSDGHHRNLGLWISVVGIICGVIGAALYYQNELLQKDAQKDGTQLVPGNAERPELKFAAVNLPPGLPPDIEAELKREFEKKREQPPKDMAILVLGDNLVRTPEKHFPKCIIRQDNEEMMTLEQTSDGLSVSAKFFNSEGKIVCELLKNRFALNHNSVFRIERKSQSDLIVFNDEAVKTLEVEYISPLTVRITGDFFLRNGVRIFIGDNALVVGRIILSGGDITAIGIPVVGVGETSGALWAPNTPVPPEQMKSQIERATGSMAETVEMVVQNIQRKKERQKADEEDRRLWGSHLPPEEQKKFLTDCTKGFVTEQKWDAIVQSLSEIETKGTLAITVNVDDPKSLSVGAALYKAFGLGGFGGVFSTPDDDAHSHDGIVVYGPPEDPVVDALAKALTDAKINFRTDAKVEDLKQYSPLSFAGVSVGRLMLPNPSPAADQK